MISRKKSKREAFVPKTMVLRRVLREAIKRLKPEEIIEIEAQVRKVAKGHYLRDLASWRRFTDAEWFSHRLKEILNVRAGRPINDYRTGALTLSDLGELAQYFGVEASSKKNRRSILWSQIDAKVKEDEDTLLNRLQKLWNKLEVMLNDTDVDRLMVEASGRWTSRNCYRDPQWKKANLSTIFEASYLIRQVANLKLGGKIEPSVVHGLSTPLLFRIATGLMDLDLPARVTKDQIWDSILEKPNKTK